jgi:WD40 repeat protein
LLTLSSLLKRVTLVFVGLAASGSGSTQSSASVVIATTSLTASSSVRLIRAPAGYDFLSAAWASKSGELIVAARRGTNIRSSHLYQLRLDGSGFQRLPLAGRSRCLQTSEIQPTSLGDGRIGYLETCWENISLRPDRARSLWAYSVAHRTSTRLRSYSLPFTASAFTFSPDLERGVLDNGGHLDWIGKRGLTPMSIPASLDGTDDPAWSPNGRYIAFTGEPTGWPMHDAAIYRLSIGSRSLQRLIAGLEGVSSPSWSPDSRWLVVAMKPRGGLPGLWLIRASNGSKRLLLGGDDFGDTEWSPDGKTIVVQVGALVSGPQSRSGLYVIKADQARL